MAIIFSKVLSESDVKKRLSIPSRHLKSFSLKCGHEVDFRAKDESGEELTLRCSIRKKNHPKPVLTTGWLAFVRSKKLQAGDKVSFYNEDGPASAAQYKIEVEYAVKLFGEVVGYAPSRAF